MKIDFVRNKRETKDDIESLSIQIEKKAPRKKQLALQLTINIAAYIVLFALMGGLDNLMTFLGLMLASTVAQIVMEVILSKKDSRKYNTYLKKVEHRVDDYLEMYKDYKESVLVPASKLYSIISNRSAALYCKLPTHKDFLTVNLGESTADYPININYPTFAYNEDNHLKSFEVKMNKKLNSKKTDILPYGISLRDNKSVTFVNKNLSEDEFMSVINAAIMDIATFHSSEEVQICCCFDPDSALDWCCYLPHVWNGNRRLIFCDTEPENEFNLLVRNAIEDKTKHLVAIVDVNFALKMNMYSSFNAEVLPDNLSVLFFSKYGDTPTRTKCVVDCTKNKKILIGKYLSKIITLNTLSEDESFNLARKLFNIRLIDNHLSTSKDIPERANFFELFNVKTAKALPVASDRESVEIQHYFPVVIGYGKDAEKTVLDLTNDGDGNHCLVTGTNGSGKSEFLLTYILSACAKYSPEYFSFVTIDFKGGLMSSKVKDLPHCLGEFTNGQATLREITRIAKLLESEIDYREKVLNQYGCNGSLYKYHDLYKKGLVKTPLPRLLVVVDEAAVFFSEDSSAINYITKIATVGRQLGIILMLSTQSQHGVIPSQVRTNINVCVDFYSEDSGKKNQSKIKGRAIINSNSKSEYVCQVALSSVYDSNFAVLDYLSISGKSRLINGQEPRQQFELIHDELLERYSYPAELGNVLTQNLDSKYRDYPLILTDLQEKYYQDGEESSRVPLGVSDNIFSREYNYFEYEPSKYNLLIYGASQSGKTTFIKSLLSAMFDVEFRTVYRPSTLNVYIIAKNPKEYLNYKEFPHVGNVLPESQLYYFLLFLLRTINERKTMPQYREYPHIIAVLDDCYGSISNLQNETLATLFSAVTAESVKYRISVILTMSSKPGFMNPALNNFNSKISFYMGEDFDYSNLLHLDAIKNLPDCPGRCLVDVVDQCAATLETQIALPYRNSENDEIKVCCDNYCYNWMGKEVPVRIPLMPDIVSMSIDSNLRKIPVGYYEDRSPCYWNFEENNTYLISYFADKDATSFIRYLIKAFTVKGFDVVIFDNQRGRLMNVAQNDCVKYFSIYDKKKFSEEIIKKQSISASKDTILVALDFSRALERSTGSELASDNKLCETLFELIKDPRKRFYGVFAEFKDNINTFRAITYESTLCATLEGAGSGMLLGNRPSDHTFGFSALPFKEQNDALNTEWGIHVSPKNGETKKIKFAVEVENLE